MIHTDEIFDVVDDQNRVIGQAPRAVVHARGLNHRAVHVWLFNDAGQLFVQQRATSKETFPGCYDSSASGHLATGESYLAAAVRELQEEIGLIVPAGQLRRRFSLAASAETGREFVWVYGLHGSYRPVINPVELAGGQFWPLSDLRAHILSQPDKFAPSFLAIWRVFPFGELSTLPAPVV